MSETGGGLVGKWLQLLSQLYSVIVMLTISDELLLFVGLPDSYLYLLALRFGIQ